MELGLSDVEATNKISASTMHSFKNIQENPFVLALSPEIPFDHTHVENCSTTMDGFDDQPKLEHSNLILGRRHKSEHGPGHNKLSNKNL